MTQFASNDEFAARLGITLTTDEGARATTLLELASALIQSETEQTIELVTDDTLTMPSVYDERIRLPQRPVSSITSVSIDGTDIPQSGAWYLDGDELVRANWRLLLQQHFAAYNGVGWLGPLRTIEIVYTHGYTTIPATVKIVCMEMAVRAWVNPGAVARESVGNVMTVYDNMRFSPSGMLMTDLERKAVNDVVRRTEGSVSLR